MNPYLKDAVLEFDLGSCSLEEFVNGITDVSGQLHDAHISLEENVDVTKEVTQVVEWCKMFLSPSKRKSQTEAYANAILALKEADEAVLIELPNLVTYEITQNIRATSPSTLEKLSDSKDDLAIFNLTQDLSSEVKIDKSVFVSELISSLETIDKVIDFILLDIKRISKSEDPSKELAKILLYKSILLRLFSHDLTAFVETRIKELTK